MKLTVFIMCQIALVSSHRMAGFSSHLTIAQPHQRFARHIQNEELEGTLQAFNGLNAQRCTQTCLKDLTTMQEDTNLEEILNGIVSNKKALVEHCTVVNSSIDRAHACGSFQMKELLISAIHPLAYICGEKYEAFISSVPCFAKTQSLIKESCIEQCGGEHFSSQSMEKIKALGKSFDFKGMLAVLDSLCEVMKPCAVCEAPIIKENCGNDRATQLMWDWNKASMGEPDINKMLLNLAGASEMPKHCAKIAEGEKPF